jgi:hypothetical protein
LNGARAFENAVTPGSVKIASVTGRSDEGFGSTINVTNNITIQGHGQSNDEIASIVALKIQNAVKTAYNSLYT